MLRALRSLIKANPATHRLALAVRRAISPTDADVLQRFVNTEARNIARPVFVKVGANDGVTGDPFGYSLLKNAAWKGLLIEPVPYCVDRLKAVYRDRSRFIIDQVAVGRSRGTATFYYVSRDAARALPDLPDWFDQLGSFDRQHIVRHLGGRIVPFIVSVDVEIDSLTNILRKHGISDVALLHIDTEGYDLEVLKSVELGEIHPLWIMVEHKHLSGRDRAEMISILEGGGYDVRDTGSDFFALSRQSRHDLHERVSVGRAVNGTGRPANR